MGPELSRGEILPGVLRGKGKGCHIGRTELVLDSRCPQPGLQSALLGGAVLQSSKFKMLCVLF